VPDVCPNEVFANAGGKFDFSMTAGEFIDVYAPQKSKLLKVLLFRFMG
jgi:hypothetical protein